MRLSMAAIAAGVILALVLPFGAEAGGKGAVRAPIYQGGVYEIAPGVNRTYANGDEVGFAILNATKDDTLTIMIKIQDGLPDTTFAVTFVPATGQSGNNWEAPPLSLTTDGKGKGSLSTELDIPAGFVNAGVALIKIILTSADDDIYVTDTRDPPFVNPPDAFPGSTTHSVNLK